MCLLLISRENKKQHPYYCTDLTVFTSFHHHSHFIMNENIWQTYKRWSWDVKINVFKDYTRLQDRLQVAVAAGLLLQRGWRWHDAKCNFLTNVSLQSICFSKTSDMRRCKQKVINSISWWTIDAGSNDNFEIKDSTWILTFIQCIETLLYPNKGKSVQIYFVLFYIEVAATFFIKSLFLIPEM